MKPDSLRISLIAIAVGIFCIIWGIFTNQNRLIGVGIMAFPIALLLQIISMFNVRQNSNWKPDKLENGEVVKARILGRNKSYFDYEAKKWGSLLKLQAVKERWMDVPIVLTQKNIYLETKYGEHETIPIGEVGEVIVSENEPSIKIIHSKGKAEYDVCSSDVMLNLNADDEKRKAKEELRSFIENVKKTKSSFKITLR